MKNLLKIDFRRAICNKQFIIMITIGILISLVHLYVEVIPYIKYYENGSAYFNPFVKWISFEWSSSFSCLFYFLLPALASFPYCQSYWVDKNSGFNKNIYTRVKRKNYFISRYITNFIIGGVAVIIPLILNFYILLMMVPAINPSVFSVNSSHIEMFSSLFYFHPYLYVGIYIILAFIFGGTFASIGLAFSAYCRNKFLVISTPILIYISMSIFELAELPYLVPLKFLSAGQPVYPTNLLSIIIIFLTLFIGSLLAYIKGVSKDECI